MLFACGDAPSTTTEADTPSTPTATTSTPVDATEAPVTAQDQIEQTTENNPEAIDPEKLPEVEVEDIPATPKSPETLSPKRPAKPKTDGTETPPPPKPELKESASPPTATTIPETLSTAPATPTPIPAPPAPPAPAPAPEKLPTAPSHAAWNTLLDRYVDNSGNVDYGGFQKAGGQLEDYLETLQQNPPTKAWTRNERLAYWINVYNAHTVKLIVDNYPVSSIVDLYGGKPWDRKWIGIGGKTYSLNNIEHDIIRPRFGDARIHFAVNCAAASCPPLPSQAFTASNLNQLLNNRTRAFIRSKKYNDIAADEVRVSKIFDWYGEDFGDLRAYLNKYASISIPEGTKIAFKDYDWALNGK